MIADIHPIFTLKIAILAHFIRGKKTKIVWGLLTHAFTRASPWTPWGAYSSPQTPSCNHFWLHQKLMHQYFFCIIHCITYIYKGISVINSPKGLIHLS